MLLALGLPPQDEDSCKFGAFFMYMAAVNAKSGLADNSLAENDMESTIRENAFAILNCRPPSMNIDATS